MEVYAANRGRYAARIGGTVRPDLVVLCPALPDSADLGPRAPVLLLTDRPLAETLDDVHALLRTEREDTGLLRNGPLTLDPAAREVRRDGHRIPLASREFDLLAYLMANAGQVVTKSQILDRVWHAEFPGNSGIVETYVHALRRKLDDHDRSLIHTVRGLGYRMDRARRGPSFGPGQR
ncbi:response regulator transcription factor [Streptomyces sp. SID13726]|nr:response regulator transcription factor [Streptomyces sp. SID13726]NEB03311.1 response regulator transcription factor [Streptomyces sp. SID13726]